MSWVVCLPTDSELFIFFAEILLKILELPAKQHSQFGQIGSFEVIGLDCECCLADSSKMAPSIFIF